MSCANEIINDIESGHYDRTFSYLYRSENVAAQSQRYLQLVKALAGCGCGGDVMLFSSPGRTELGGNQVDHNGGRVLAAAVNIDIAAAVSRRDDNTVCIRSDNYPDIIVDISDTAVHDDEQNTSHALIRGVAAEFSKRGFKTCGFDAVSQSNVPGGAGLSSSAAFETLIAEIFNRLCNGGKIDFITIAKVSQIAEREFFGKPCGLMDQMACAAGGIVSIDFADPDSPKVERMKYDFASKGYALCIVNTGSCHSDLTSEYAAVPGEMFEVAKLLGKPSMCGVSYDELYAGCAEIRSKCGDRALLRAYHFIDESSRAADQKKALTNNDFDRYLELVSESGDSSYKYCQNVFTMKNSRDQGVALGLYVAGRVLASRGACRVHGGGFGGTTQNYVPFDLLDDFIAAMEHVFGGGCCHTLSIRPCGPLMLSAE